MKFSYPDETDELTESTRKQYPGASFVQLGDGVTHYELKGTENAHPVVLVHGFSTPCFIFDATFNFLLESGFHVLRYDLFGRGLSDRPNLDYTMDVFVNQLRDLVQALKIRQFSLLGLSMGGAISTVFIQRHPQEVLRQILIDPAGAQAVPLPWMVKALRLPGVGELAFRWIGSARLIAGLASDVIDAQTVEYFQNQYKIQLKYKGFKQALLSTIRSGMLGSFLDAYQAVGKLGKPTLLLWGVDDPVIPLEQSVPLLQAIPHAEFYTIERGGHIPHYERQDIVHPLLKEFLSN